MPGARLPMRKIRDMLRLTAAGMSSRKIAASLSIGGTTVVDCLQRARAVGVGWPLPEDLSDVALEARLFPASTALAAFKSRRTQAEWPAIHRELKRPGVTLRLLWEEHRAAHPEGYGYSRYVAAAVMWRKTWAQAGEGWFPWLDPQHNFELRGYRAFRNVISDGSARGRGLVCRSVISTRASALAFISISTSA